MNAANGEFRWALSGQTEIPEPESTDELMRHLEGVLEHPSAPVFLPIVH